MASGCECAPGRAAPPSRIVARKAGSDSPPDYETLRNSRDFRRVLDRGVRRRSDGISVASIPGEAGPPRVGLVVSRSCGSAVRRNRIKRRLRAGVNHIELKPGTEYVIIATPQVADMPFDRLVEALRHAVAEGAS